MLLLLSLQGADLIEFDVQLTKDDIPVIYHDFKVLITYRKVISVYFNPLVQSMLQTTHFALYT